jgi:hypothetical protein
MLRPGSTPASRGLLLVGSAIALVFAVWLTYYGVDYARGGCDCDDPLLPDWSGWLLVALATPAYLASALLLKRALRRNLAG